MQAQHTPGGSIVVTVDDLRVGDRLEVTGVNRPWWIDIVEIDEAPKTRVITTQLGTHGLNGSVSRRWRRAKRVARAPREDERNA